MNQLLFPRKPHDPGTHVPLCSHAEVSEESLISISSHSPSPSALGVPAATFDLHQSPISGAAEVAFFIVIPPRYLQLPAEAGGRAEKRELCSRVEALIKY